MNSWMGGGMWVWTVVGILLVILLAVLIGRATKKQSPTIKLLTQQRPAAAENQTVI